MKISRGKYYYELIVFPTVREMYSFYDNVQTLCLAEPGKHDFAACVMPVKAIPHKTRKYFIGYILICETHNHISLVAHEMVHAALWYDRLIYKNRKAEFGDYTTSKEERLATTVERFISQYTRNHK